MRPADQIAVFVHDALAAGRSRDEISEALAKAGWAPNEISDSLNAWVDSDFSPPVPRPRAYVSAQEAFFYGLMFAALGMTAWHLTTLSFNLIDRWLPDPSDIRPASYALGQMRWSIASLIVFAPLFLILNTRATRETRVDPGKSRSGVRKWFGYITLFIASISLLGDLMYAIFALLSGDLTLRFIAKSIVVAVVAGIIFFYFSKETNEKKDAL
ncbi:DUF5671 domain-containing protein [Pseudohalocynthiibacter aestuariivivens]|uniref:DUF5671 domain-containing protein n=1 Tax=Pseudohalocynthiibacter aestuariivivens TaxID=1591409 RepID=A0ABV5JI62_9RHOB|nr:MULTISPECIES: DUF5671 domain-containing protein [Pseudohalocynthiibacter]MBS9717455.1 hypothetical protein [Pseudohalocynthiibacter aestuariivivens]MCK0102210.1 DUF5671 domain-containing protein [Pseudohalocynthiibacter sp. F2068]